MSVQVKTILHRGPNEDTLPRKEIRRFEIDENATGRYKYKLHCNAHRNPLCDVTLFFNFSYDFLRAKIIALYPDMTDETPFRLMWTDEEGDNVCFSTDEELVQALKFVKSQENKLFKVIVKTPQVQAEQAAMGANRRSQSNRNREARAETMDFAEPVEKFVSSCMNMAGSVGNAAAANMCQAFDNKNWKPERLAKKCEKMKAKQQFHEQKAKDIQNLIRNINPAMQEHIQNLIGAQGAQVSNVSNRGNGDVDIAVDIPIHHSSSSSSTTTTTKTTTNQPVYPDLQQEQPMEEEHGFTDVAAEVQRARMNEAISKMAELGFEGDWVKTLLESVNCDIAQAVEKMTPNKN